MPHSARADWRGRVLWGAGICAAAVVLSWCYLLQARTQGANSDGAGMALQGWDMLHGNVLLRGWWTADVSFYTFEIPVDALVIAVRGLSADVVHVTAGIVYALLVLAVALLGRGTARGRAGIVRALLAAGIMIAPALGEGTRVLLGSPDHVGVGVPIVLTLLLVDRAREHWWVPVAVCAMLLWASLDDPMAEIAAALPLAVVCLARAVVSLRCHGARGNGSLSRGGWRYDAGLAAGAAASYELTQVAVRLISASGGYSMRTLSAAVTFIPASRWGIQLLHAGQNALLLFGADYFWQPGPLAKAIAVLHLAGAALALGGLAAGIITLARGGDRVTQALTLGTLVTLGAGAFANPMMPGYGAHEITVVLPFGAVLAGRTVGPWLMRRGLHRPARAVLAALLAAAAAGYLAALGYSATRPSVPARTQALAGFLTAHDLTSGIGMYWAANITTAISDWHVRVIPAQPGPASPDSWVTRPSWYDPESHCANFVIAGKYTASATTYPVRTVLRDFGRPAREYRFDGYVIMVYDRNLLRSMHRPVQPDPDRGTLPLPLRYPSGTRGLIRGRLAGDGEKLLAEESPGSGRMQVGLRERRRRGQDAAEGVRQEPGVDGFRVEARGVQVLGEAHVRQDDRVVGTVEVVAGAVLEVGAHDRDPAARPHRVAEFAEQRRHRVLVGQVLKEVRHEDAVEVGGGQVRLHDVGDNHRDPGLRQV